MNSKKGTADFSTLPIIEKVIYSKHAAPVTKKVLEHKTWGPVVKKALDREIVTYLFFGVLTTVVGFFSFEFCRRLHASAVVSNVVSSVVAIAFAFIVNKQFVFLSRDWSFRNTVRELWQFTGGRLIVMAGETGLLYLLVDRMGLHDSICKIFTLILVMIANYIISKFIF